MQVLVVSAVAVGNQPVIHALALFQRAARQVTLLNTTLVADAIVTNIVAVDTTVAADSMPAILATVATVLLFMHGNEM